MASVKTLEASMNELLEKLHEKADGLAIDVYHLLEEIAHARRGYSLDGSFPLDRMFDLLAKIEVRMRFMEINAQEIDQKLNEERITLNARQDG
jgi:hypothetical protein